MSYSNPKQSADELWAVMYKDGSIAYSRGGSSTAPKLMIYETEGKALGSLKSKWIQQVINPKDVNIKCIYKATEKAR
jgi:hypothetical protein